METLERRERYYRINNEGAKGKLQGAGTIVKGAQTRTSVEDVVGDRLYRQG